MGGWTMDTREHKVALEKEFERLTVIAEHEAQVIANDIARRGKQNIEPGAINDAIKVEGARDALGWYFDVGVFPSSQITKSGDATPQEAAVPLEFGHIDGGTYVSPHPFMRPAFAAAAAAAASRPVEDVP